MIATQCLSEKVLYRPYHRAQAECGSAHTPSRVVNMAVEEKFLAPHLAFYLLDEGKATALPVSELPGSIQV